MSHYHDIAHGNDDRDINHNKDGKGDNAGGVGMQ